MKKTMNTLGIVGSSILLIGAIMKSLHLMGANEGLVLGGLTIVLGYLPLLLILSLRQTDALIGQFRNLVGYIGANLIVIGVVFQVLHLPFGKIALLAGIVFFIFLFVPLFFKSLGKEALASIHPATLTVIVLAIASSFFAFSVRSPSNAYIQNLITINKNIEESYQKRYNRINDISPKAQETLNYITDLKSFLLASIEPTNDQLFRGNIFRFDEKLKEIMLYDTHEYNGKELQNKMTSYLDQVQKKQPGISTILEEAKKKDWLESNFRYGPLYTIYTELSSYQLEIINLEMEVSN